MTKMMITKMSRRSRRKGKPGGVMIGMKMILKMRPMIMIRMRKTLKVGLMMKKKLRFSGILEPVFLG